MSQLQIKASNPDCSVWVSASAGTGKTRILTDRVLRLLLNNVPDDKILCLTFTNAATGEMKQRIGQSLLNWSIADESELYLLLKKILGKPPSELMLARAQKLYDLYLESDNQINIHTIHSFCQKLLKKFPLEAGISPNFMVMDEIKFHEIIEQIKKQLSNSQQLELINNYFAENFHPMKFDEIFYEIINQKNKFPTSKDELDNIYDLSKEIISKLEENQDFKYQTILNHPIIQNLVGIDINVGELKNFFLTKSGEKKKRIVSVKIAKPDSSLYNDLQKIQENIYQLDQQEKANHVVLYSKLLYLLGNFIVTTYEKHKETKGLLDYDDLIKYAGILLTQSAEKEWVLYKLDGGIEHLLVDEAQDTSPEQWQIISALIEEFHSGENNNDKNRSVFVVGDEKQSIFSFQGADVSSFNYMNNLLNKKLKSGGKNFISLDLDISYRSAKEIIDVVLHLFNRIKKQTPNLFTANIPDVAAFRTEYSGSVELWPLCLSPKNQDIFWPIINDEIIGNSGKTILANQIADFIAEKINSKRILPSTGKQISAADFMILFRKRDELTSEVIKAIKNKNIEITGLDRMLLSDNLAVLDLISAAKFAINPDDDLNLAALLKSPVIGLDDDWLQKLAIGRGQNSIWQKLTELGNTENLCSLTYNKLNLIRQIYSNHNVSDFFHILCDVIDYRSILNEYCGTDSNDAIDELLFFSHNYAKTNDTSLQNFIFWFENYEAWIKRDTEKSDKVKIMTVHGSKGLQSPYVILCDTTNVPTNHEYFVEEQAGNLLSVQNSSYSPESYKNLKAIRQEKIYQEYLRLLYVAMTRAEDHLIVCGYQGNKTTPDNCWYELVKNSMTEIANNSGHDKLIYGQDESGQIATKENQPINIETITTNPSNITNQYYADLQEGNDQNTTYRKLSPLRSEDPFEYGVIFHKILEDTVKFKDISVMSTHPLIGTLNKKLQTKIKNSIEKITANSEFQQLITKDTRTEITIGMNDKTMKIGRIDLAVFDNNKITIIDYKSDSNPPTLSQQVPDNYRKQLDFYRKAMKQIYPSMQITCKILWLENGKLQPVN